jgi:hypothetical protein
MASPEMVVAPREAAAMLEVAPSTLRRLATVYANVYGRDSLPWSDGGKGGGSRLWTGEALRRTRAARQLVESGRASSFKIALESLKDAPEGALTLSPIAFEDNPGVAALRDEVAALRAELKEVRGEVAAMKALPAKAEPERADEPPQTPVPEGRAEAEHPPERAPNSSPAESSSTTHGPIVKLAMWLEARWRRS